MTAETDDPRPTPEWDEGLVEFVRKLVHRMFRRDDPLRISLQTFDIVNEVYLRTQGDASLQGMSQDELVPCCAQLIREEFARQARFRAAEKRGGGNRGALRLEFEDTGGPSSVDILDLEDALTKLHQREPRHAQVAVLRFYAGLEYTEIARLLDVSVRTAQNDWRFARAYLDRLLDS